MRPKDALVPKLCVARSRNAERTWKLLNKGLPQSNAHVLVLREAMTSYDRDPAGVYFGASTGTLFHSRDAGVPGKSWLSTSRQSTRSRPRCTDSLECGGLS